MWAVALHADAGDDLRGWLEAQLRWYGHGYRLGDDGDLLHGKDPAPTGIGWALEPAGAYADRPWHVAGSPCPYVAPLAGYLRLEPRWREPAEDFELRLACVREGRGVIARLDDDQARTSVARQPRALRNVGSKFGFDDGAELLTRDEGPYASSVLEEARAAAAAAGYGIEAGWMATSHNPCRLSWVERAGVEGMVPAVWELASGRLVDPDQAFAGQELALWLYDFAVLDDDAFWRAW